ncbi:MAG: hypothetical protein IPK83_03155 [Planctomycetes bacterium]|nr:hypothetical protein [Planctomycetota bacterium]
MNKKPQNRASVFLRPFACAAAIVFAGAPACNNPNNQMQETSPYKATKQPTSEPLPISAPPNMEESNIIRVNKIFDSFPWLSFSNDGSGRVNGFKCAVYLEGPKSTKGVFGSGTMVITMYRLDHDRLNREVPTEMKCWTFTREEALPYRARNMSMLGWGYGFRLPWGDDIRVSGRKIAIVIKYVRDDGRVVSSSRKVLRVPFTGDVQPMPQRESQPNVNARR